MPQSRDDVERQRRRVIAELAQDPSAENSTEGGKASKDGASWRAWKWSSCELGEHIEEVRTRTEELSRLLTGQPFDARVLDAVWLQVAAVRELLDPLLGLHEPDVP